MVGSAYSLLACVSAGFIAALFCVGWRSAYHAFREAVASIDRLFRWAAQTAFPYPAGRTIVSVASPAVRIIGLDEARAFRLRMLARDLQSPTSAGVGLRIA